MAAGDGLGIRDEPWNTGKSEVLEGMRRRSVPNSVFGTATGLSMTGSLHCLDDLRKVSFGSEFPRHGLKLLYWFAVSCVEFSPGGVMKLKCDPYARHFGFHYYGNYEKLLPEHKQCYFRYFVVGNLNPLTHPRALDLPNYVKGTYGSNGSFEQNMDRIIISFNNITKIITDVYITEHWHGLKCFRPDGTYLLSPELLKIVQQMTLTEFLTRTATKYYTDESSDDSNELHTNECAVEYSNDNNIGFNNKPKTESMHCETLSRLGVKQPSPAVFPESLCHLGCTTPVISKPSSFHNATQPVTPTETHKPAQSNMPSKHMGKKTCHSQPISHPNFLQIHTPDLALRNQTSCNVCVSDSGLPSSSPPPSPHHNSATNSILSESETGLECQSQRSPTSKDNVSELQGSGSGCWLDSADVAVLSFLTVLAILVIQFYFVRLGTVLLVELLLGLAPIPDRQRAPGKKPSSPHSETPAGPLTRASPVHPRSGNKRKRKKNKKRKKK
ncbi:uncharacterized protein LOC125720601 [Brienomyrus brachyistius]|uniref:uncharacterized protein LOC125720601 n=1 Tax=Brienomyrus brachyistius TaxID=42636 RepID=UPI0020B4515F|nr:uncharacterized protein LOC125720601 [Brienomyrus brachyistius]